MCTLTVVLTSRDQQTPPDVRHTHFVEMYTFLCQRLQQVRTLAANKPIWIRNFKSPHLSPLSAARINGPATHEDLWKCACLLSTRHGTSTNIIIDICLMAYVCYQTWNPEENSEGLARTSHRKERPHEILSINS